MIAFGDTVNKPRFYDNEASFLLPRPFSTIIVHKYSVVILERLMLQLLTTIMLRQGCAKLIDFDWIFDFGCENFRNFRF